VGKAVQQTILPIKPLCIDLFAGAGGASLGMANAGFEVVAVEMDKWACKTHQANSRTVGDVIRADVTQLPLRKDLVPTCVWASAPCQDFSTANQYKKKDSPRAFLVVEAAKQVVYLRPLGFIFENVPSVLKSWQWAEAKKILKAAGYNLRDYLLDAVNYGVPQYRERAFMVGSRVGPAPPRPIPTHGSREEIERLIKNKGRQSDGSVSMGAYKAALRWKEAMDENETLEMIRRALGNKKKITVLNVQLGS
jgi:DNA (cytosine-5)-methyltransferase 1